MCGYKSDDQQPNRVKIQKKNISAKINKMFIFRLILSSLPRARSFIFILARLDVGTKFRIHLNVCVCVCYVHCAVLQGEKKREKRKGELGDNLTMAIKIEHWLLVLCANHSKEINEVNEIERVRVRWSQ